MKVNGKDFPIGNFNGNGISSILEFYQLKPETVAVSVNGEIADRNSWNSVLLSEDDQIEIIKFVGGG